MIFLSKSLFLFLMIKSNLKECYILHFIIIVIFIIIIVIVNWIEISTTEKEVSPQDFSRVFDIANQLLTRSTYC